MHLALICNEYPPAPHGGIGSFSQDLAEGMVGAGHAVTVVGIYAKQPQSVTESIRGVTVVRLPSAKLPWYRPCELFDRWRLRCWLRRQHHRTPFDLVEVPDFDGWFPASKSRRPWPVIARLHGSNLFFDSELGRSGEPFRHQLERRTVAGADFWLGVSKYVFEKTMVRAGIKEHAGQVIYNGVDTTLFSPDPTVPVTPGLIVFVNKLNDKKGVPQLIDAAQIIFASNPEARLVLIGSEAAGFGRPKSYPEEMRERVRADYWPRITFTGQLDRREIIPWLRRANVCCYPSRMETFGLAPVEAMAAGKPTIYSAAGPGPEIIEDGRSGLLCDANDPADIAAKIKRILDDPTMAKKMGQEARRRVVENFGKSDSLRQNIEFYQSCLQRKK